MRTLAGWCVRHRRIVVLLWLIVLVASLGIGTSVGSAFTNNLQFPHTQSVAAINSNKATILVRMLTSSSTNAQRSDGSLPVAAFGGYANALSVPDAPRAPS